MSLRTRIGLLFFLSGIGGLMYQTVWLRMLTRVLGTTVYASAVVIAAFMGGLALGSWVIGRWAVRRADLLRWYALLELGVGVSALFVSLVIPLLAPAYAVLYRVVAGNRFALVLLQSAVLSALLLVPTFLMGGTLPVLAAYTRRLGGDVAPRIGLLYGLNTAGAVAGVLAAGFLTIATLGERGTVLLGLVVNLVVFLAAWRMSAGDMPEPPVERADAARVETAGDAVTRRLVIAGYCAGGFAAMGYEIVWTRIMQIHAGTSVYAFTLMLAFYLAGIAAGSLFGGRFAGRLQRPLAWFGAGQVLVALLDIAGLYLFTVARLPIFMGELRLNIMLQVPLLLVVPVTFVLGCLMPVVVRGYVAGESGVSAAVGRLYALNTLGGIAGSLATGFILVGMLGTRMTVVALAVVNLTVGLVALIVAGRASCDWRPAVVGAVLVPVVVGFMIGSPDPFLYAVGRKVRMLERHYGNATLEFFHNKEGIAANATAMGFTGERRSRQLLINGVGMTNLCVETKLMAHLPLLLHRNPSSMLVVCFGMGTAVRSAAAHPLSRIDSVELVPQAYEFFPYYHADAAAIAADPRVRFFVDDGRNFLLVRPDTYDVISMDPAPPVWSAGTVNLYTREFFSLCRDRLNRDGVMCCWLPPAELSELSRILRAFLDVFPATNVWEGPEFKGLYVMGFKSGAAVRAGRFLDDVVPLSVRADLREWGVVDSVRELANLYVAGPEELAVLLRETPAVTDDMPYTEFPLWRTYFDPEFRYVLTGPLLARLCAGAAYAAGSAGR
jgi:spermidine synthase